MATLRSDIIIPEVFTPYVIEQTTQRDAFLASGVVQPMAELNAAEGGGDFTVVVISPFVVTVLFVVDSVTIGSVCANADPILITMNAKVITSLFIMSILIMTSAYTDIYESQYSTSI